MEKEFDAEIMISFKESVLDPQGQVVEHALSNLGFDNIHEVRIGKWIQLKVKAANNQKAEERVHLACEKLLVNKVIETYHFQIREAGEAH
jgi:phosphoribosylformylglycinamidine synthase